MLYAGFDCSTQSLSVVVVDVSGSRRDVVFRDSLTFDDDLPGFQSRHGVTLREDDGSVHTNPLLWSTALEVMLARLSQGVDARRIRGISGSAQQHGSVYCGATPEVLTRPTSPVWMDSSTLRECEEIEAAVGGSRALAQLTGSAAFPRFTGPQIRRFARTDPDAYDRTDRIHLVSSYLASMLIGAHAPIDHADGSGMNLMDIRTRRWADEALDATAPRLREKLGPLVPSSTVIGTLAEGWQSRFGLPAAAIVAWSGDNPCSLVGSGLVVEGQLGISLGTSDTIFGPMPQPRISADGTGHVFASPTGEYMGITVFRNGSLARERIRDRFGLDWAGFSAALRTTPAGNDGALMLPWFEPEITPLVSSPRPVETGFRDDRPARYVRAIVEAQMMALAAHSRWMGVAPSTISATGGAAANREILQIMADVFDAAVSRFESTDSAALGAALRAWQADTGLPWLEITRPFVRSSASPIVPVESNVTIYKALQPRYSALERAALSGW
ncbi:MAG TPA: FGGY family carbohydrate kinase [Vicinamibacterales bacterium]